MFIKNTGFKAIVLAQKLLNRLVSDFVDSNNLQDEEVDILLEEVQLCVENN